MDSFGIDFDDIDLDVGEGTLSIEVPTIDNIIPHEGLFLGLDISKNSTGITYIEDGKRVVGNIVLDDTKGVHKEVLLRRELKKDLLQLVEGKEFDLIIIEDAYVGENADTVRKLFALNTAIDELILDGMCRCKKFIRVNNKRWKSWLSVLDTAGVAKGLNDKEKVRVCLEMIGVVEEGEGYQDRLDSTGLLVGYFLKGRKLDKEKKLGRKKKIRLVDVKASYDIDSGYLFYGRDDVNTDNIVFLDCTRIGKDRMLELLTDNPEAVFVTEKPVKLGNLGIDLNLDILEDGGYFAFWVNPKKLKKYLNKEDS